jgi:hypothetical protein
MNNTITVKPAKREQLGDLANLFSVDRCPLLREPFLAGFTVIEKSPMHFARVHMYMQESRPTHLVQDCWKSPANVFIILCRN